MYLFIDPYYVKKKFKKKKKAKTQRKRNRNPRNSFYVEIRLPHLNAVKSRCEETTKAGQVSEHLSASPATTIPYPLSQNQHQKVSLAQDINSY